MKRTIAFILALMLAACCLPVMSFASIRPVKNLPSEVRQNLKSKYSGYSVTDYDYGNNFLFVNVENHSGTNTLIIYRINSSGEWYHWAHTTKGVPQSSTGTLHVDVESGYWDHRTGSKKYSYDTLHLYMMNEGGYVTTEAWYSNVSGSSWKLMRYFRQSHNYGVTVGDSQLTYFSGSNMQTLRGTVYGSIQRDLRYTSLSTIPKSVKDAEAKLTTEPDLPKSSQLTPVEGVRFPGGKKYPVYSGPGKYTLRSGNGKAAVSTNDWIQVFGMEDDYILIYYSVDAGHYRFGYITADSVSSDSYVPTLDFDFTPVSVEEDTFVTDDPFNSLTPIAYVSSSDTLSLLATIGTWSYIEGDNYRGFVPSSCLDSSDAASTESVIGNDDSSVG